MENVAVSQPVSIAILASGRGSNFDAIAEAIAQGSLEAKIIGVISDREKAAVLTKAAARGIPAKFIPAEADPDSPIEERRRRHDRKVVAALQEWRPKFIVMAGYMRVVTDELIEAFRSDRGYSRIVNIHPSLLPAFPGKDSYRQAFEQGAKVAGVTVHLVEQEVDSGPICDQRAFPIGDCKTVMEVEEKGLKIEHELYPATLRWVLPENFEVNRRGRTCVSPN